MNLNAQTLAQIYGPLRILVAAGLSAAAGAGWLRAADASDLTSALAVAVPAMVTLALALWSIFAHSKSAVIAQAASMPDVKAVVATPAIADSPTFLRNDKVVTPAQAVTRLPHSPDLLR
jgi:hypothetical protein